MDPARGPGSPTPRPRRPKAPSRRPARDGAPRSAAAPPRTADTARRSPRRHAHRARHRPRHAPARRPARPSASCRYPARRPRPPGRRGCATASSQSARSRCSGAARPTNGPRSTRASAAGRGTGGDRRLEEPAADSPSRSRGPSGATPSSARTSAARLRSNSGRRRASSSLPSRVRSLIATRHSSTPRVDRQRAARRRLPPRAGWPALSLACDAATGVVHVLRGLSGTTSSGVPRLPIDLKEGACPSERSEPAACHGAAARARRCSPSSPGGLPRRWGGVATAHRGACREALAVPRMRRWGLGSTCAVACRSSGMASGWRGRCRVVRAGCCSRS